MIRKQYLISQSTVTMIDQLAEQENVSPSEIVRRAIDAYEPDVSEDWCDEELLQRVRIGLKQAIVSTQATNHKVARTLRVLSDKSR